MLILLSFYQFLSFSVYKFSIRGCLSVITRESSSLCEQSTTINLISMSARISIFSGYKVQFCLFFRPFSRLMGSRNTTLSSLTILTTACPLPILRSGSIVEAFMINTLIILVFIGFATSRIRGFSLWVDITVVDTELLVWGEWHRIMFSLLATFSIPLSSTTAPSLWPQSMHGTKFISSWMINAAISFAAIIRILLPACKVSANNLGTILQFFSLLLLFRSDLFRDFTRMTMRFMPLFGDESSILFKENALSFSHLMGITIFKGIHG